MGRGISITIHGMDKLMEQLDRMPEAARRGAEAGMKKAAQRTLEKAQGLVPYATGKLHDSGHVVDDEDELKVVFGDDGDVDYAAIVHEKLSLQHPQGQAKYLETAANQVLDGIEEDLGPALHDELESAL